MKKAFIALITFLLPVFAFAADGPTSPATMVNTSSLAGAIQSIDTIINMIIPFIIGLAVLFFIFSLFRYVTAGADEGKRTEARNQIIFGVIIIAVMISVWGLINFVVNSAGLAQTSYSGPLPSVTVTPQNP